MKLKVPLTQGMILIQEAHTNKEHLQFEIGIINRPTRVSYKKSRDYVHDRARDYGRQIWV